MNRFSARRLASAFAFALLCALLFGCVQSSLPQACAGAAPDKMGYCIYVQATLEQNPFYCYSLQDTAARSNCIRSATDDVARKQLENSIRQGQPASTQQNVSVPVAPPVVPQPAANASCDSLSGADRDKCMLGESVHYADLLGCVKISDQAIRIACVSQVAQGTRDLSSCVNLENSTLRDICRTYAKGETPSE